AGLTPLKLGANAPARRCGSYSLSRPGSAFEGFSRRRRRQPHTGAGCDGEHDSAAPRAPPGGKVKDLSVMAPLATDQLSLLLHRSWSLVRAEEDRYDATHRGGPRR